MNNKNKTVNINNKGTMKTINKNNNLNNSEEMKKTTIVDENKFIKSAMRYYGRHIENLKCIGQGTPKWFLQGDSPFGNSSINIDQNRNWDCNATNQSGDAVDLLEKQDPLLTEKGANLAMIEETINTPDFDGKIIFDEDNIRESLNEFRQELKTWKHIGDVGKFVIMKNNLWISGYLSYKYLELSRTNKPLCRYHWSFDSSGRVESLLTCGVPRIKEHPEADRIYFVEDPLRMIFLKETVSDPIYVKPDAEMYSYNDYLKMVEGKDIVHCLTNDLYPEKIENWDFELINRGDRASVKSYFEDNL